MRYWAGGGEKDRRPVDEWWSGGVTLITINYSAVAPFQRAKLTHTPSTLQHDRDTPSWWSAASQLRPLTGHLSPNPRRRTNAASGKNAHFVSVQH